MRIMDLAPEQEPLYCVCLEDWSDEIREAGDHKANWLARMKGRGLRVKLAEADDGNIAGMIQYLPIEQAFAAGHDAYYVLCIWVHGYKQGRGNYQGRGLGSALLQAAEDDARQLGAQGMVAWGMIIPAFMRARWFRRHGYRPVDRDGVSRLLWKPFTPAAEPPQFIKAAKRPKPTPGQVTVTAFLNGWCPAQNMVYERAKRAAETFDQRVVFRTIDTSERETFLAWGIADGLFIDGQAVRTGPPPTYEAIRRQIARRVRRLK